MSLWRKTSVVAIWVGLASTPVAAQYVPSPGVQSRPYSQTLQQPAPQSVQPSYGTATPSSMTDSQVLSAALEANRRRDLATVQTYQASLTDPLARKVLTWAMVDMFAEQLGAGALEAAVRDLQGWPREDARQYALERARSGVSLPSGPVPYSQLAASREASTERIYTDRRLAMNAALRDGDTAAAYMAISQHGLTPGGSEYAEAESYSGWLALNKLKNPRLAAQHFARLDAAVRSPVSKGRAAYWRGRAAEAAGDQTAARGFYEAGAQHNTTFYGLLAAEKAGRTQLVLTPDPVTTAADREWVANNEVLRAAQLLSRAGEKNLVRVFGLHLGDTVESPARLAVLMDHMRTLGDTELVLLTYRRGAQRGHILHERGYPLRTPPRVSGGAEPAFVLAITRQESQFDPRVRSSANARGMMQIIPGTGRDMARRIGVQWDEGMLWDADYNMRLGSAYLGYVTDEFSGSYVMTAAGYNAGPSRPEQWVSFCGDPRSPSSDPLDFIECIPFSETRNYVMNVMANMAVYRARLNGGSAPLTLSQDLRRGSYRPAAYGIAR